jgi:hypothetical protein
MSTATIMLADFEQRLELLEWTIHAAEDVAASKDNPLVPGSPEAVKYDFVFATTRQSLVDVMAFNKEVRARLEVIRRSAHGHPDVLERVDRLEKRLDAADARIPGLDAYYEHLQIPLNSYTH